MRVRIVRGPHRGTIITDHDGGPYIGLVARDPRSAFDRALDRLRRRPDPPPQRTLYRIFSRAVSDDDGADVYAAAWCAEHDAFRDRCPHAPPALVRVWVRFGPRYDQTGLDAGAPGARRSKWHLLANPRQVDAPWLTSCNLIVYGPVIEEYRNAVLTPIGAPMCHNCKRVAGVVESMVAGVPH